MSGSVNKVILIGRLGKDPEVKYIAGGQAVAQLSVATDFTWTDKAGQRQEKTEWHRVVVWGKNAENCERFLAKGRMVYVEGRIETRKWQDKDGQDRYSTEIVAEQVTFLDRGEGASQWSGGGAGRTHGGGQRPPSGGGRGGSAPAAAPEPEDENLPF